MPAPGILLADLTAKGRIMDYRDMLVHLKSTEEWSSHIDYAIGLAKFSKAHLRAMITFSDIAFLRGVAHAGEGVLKDQTKRDDAVAESMKKQVATAAKKAGVTCDFVRAEGPASEIVTWASRFHDLSIIEQRDPRRDELGFDPAEQAVLAAGRPVLIVPRAGQFAPQVSHVLVAWNGSQQAAAALQGALPLIARADRVTVCAGELREPLRSNVRVPPLDIAAHLARYARKVTVEAVEIGGESAGAHLLRRANDTRADLIVMGAYGRSWLSELVLGGATRHILSEMTIPVLMGH
jgi:nucleotide-binding universal stress UspA family protein